MIQFTFIYYDIKQALIKLLSIGEGIVNNQTVSEKIEHHLLKILPIKKTG
jgi:hypothetical protein